MTKYHTFTKPQRIVNKVTPTAEQRKLSSFFVKEDESGQYFAMNDGLGNFKLVFVPR